MPVTHLFNFCLHLADNSLIMGHRLSEWAGHGPMLEQDIALSNIALDLIGQARNFYQYAALITNSSDYPLVDERMATEDSLAYLRNAREFKNIVLVELSNGDWAKTILKLFFFSTYQNLLYEQLVNSSDKQLSAVAEKSLKEVIYHVRWSSEWVIRLGDGTNESHMRLNAAFEELWHYTAEMFVAADFEMACVFDKTGVDVCGIKDGWYKKINDVFFQATLTAPLIRGTPLKVSGKEGLHTEHLNNILSQMQYLQRAYPGCDW